MTEAITLTDYVVVPHDRASYLLYKRTPEYANDLFGMPSPGEDEEAELVDLEEGVCTCEDFLLRKKQESGQTCKHIQAVKRIL